MPNPDKITLNIYFNEGVANYLGVDSITFEDDAYNLTDSEIIVIEEKRWISGFLFPREMVKEIKHRFYAKKVIWYKDGKRFLCVIPPKVKGYELDIDAMIDYLKDAITRKASSND